MIRIQYTLGRWILKIQHTNIKIGQIVKTYDNSLGGDEMEHCKYKGCWCHKDFDPPKESFYERKVRLGLIVPEEVLTDSDLEWKHKQNII